MTVYVDILRVYPNAWGPFLRGSCHLFADLEDEEQLHELARRIGMKRSWFQPDRRGDCSHYDLVASRRAAAVRLGAVEVDDRGAVAVWHANRAKASLARTGTAVVAVDVVGVGGVGEIVASATPATPGCACAWQRGPIRDRDGKQLGFGDYVTSQRARHRTGGEPDGR